MIALQHGYLNYIHLLICNIQIYAKLHTSENTDMRVDRYDEMLLIDGQWIRKLFFKDIYMYMRLNALQDMKNHNV